MALARPVAGSPRADALLRRLPLPSLVLLLLHFCPCSAALTLSHQLADGAVLQHRGLGGGACVFGGGAPGALNLTLAWRSLSASGESSFAPAADGSWRGCVPAELEYGGPYALTVTGGPGEAGSPAASNAAAHPLSVQLSDVWLGHVYLAAGQSNMARRTADAFNATAECATAERLRLHAPSAVLRFADLPWLSSPQPLAELGERIEWQVVTSAVCLEKSAVAFFFGRTMLELRPGVPVGVIAAAVDGTGIEEWWSPRASGWGGHVDAGTPAQPPCASLCGGAPPGGAGGRFNAMVAPLAGSLRVAGVLWWQGESDAGCAGYRCHLAALVNGWRAAWAAARRRHRPLIPFVVVQLHPFRLPWGAPACAADGSAFLAGAAATPATADGPFATAPLAELRAAQAAAAGALPRVGLACAVDQGDSGSPLWPGSIHTRHKRAVGERLAREAHRLTGGGGGGGGGGQGASAAAAAGVTRGPRLVSATQLGGEACDPPDGGPGRPYPHLAPYNSVWRLAFDGAGSGLVTTAFAPGAASAAAFSAHLNGSGFGGLRPRLVASILEGSLRPDGFDLWVPPAEWDYSGDRRSAVVRLDALWSDFPQPQVWNREGFPMEPFAVPVARPQGACLGAWAAPARPAAVAQGEAAAEAALAGLLM